jgi:hypothetical protein
MKRNLLITTAAAAILAATGLATAQDRGGNQGGGMEKSQPQGQMQRGQRGQAQTPPGGASRMNETRGQAPDAQNQKNPSGAAERPAKNKSMQKSEGARPADKNMQKSDTDRRPGTTRQSEDARQRDNRKNGARTRNETTGRGDASGAQLSSEQRTKIRQVVVSKRIPKVTNVNFNVSVGARVPTTVQFHPIPAEIVTIHPAWRGYRVILVGSELVIVHPRSYQIVAVIVV